MLDLHWALDRGLLDDAFDASLIAYASDPAFAGRLHLDSCWTLADQRGAADPDSTGAAPGLARLELGWTQVQALVDTRKPGTDNAVCECITEPSTQLPPEVLLAHRLGELSCLLSDTPSPQPPVSLVRLVADVADVLIGVHAVTRTGNQPLLDALDRMLAAAADHVGQVDVGRQPQPVRRARQLTYLAEAARMRYLPDQPDLVKTAAAADTADDATITDAWNQLVAASVWCEAVGLSDITARVVNGAWVDTSGRRLLIRLPEACRDGTLLGRTPVLSRDPYADPSTL